MYIKNKIRKNKSLLASLLLCTFLFENCHFSAIQPNPSLLVGASQAGVSNNLIHFASNPCDIDLASLSSTQGFRIDGGDGSLTGAYAGASVSSAGDINNDGIDDLIVGAPNFDLNAYRPSAGASYVIYGKNGGYEHPIDLINLNSTQGFSIYGEDLRGRAGGSVSSAGDINNDGISDLIIGASRNDPGGASYVIYGKAGGHMPINTEMLNRNQGFVITTAIQDLSPLLGYSVSSAGDINNDGINDLIVGAPYTYTGHYPNRKWSSGASYVIYGQNGTVNNLYMYIEYLKPTQGFRINGAADDDFSGISVSSAGDINNDGINDLIVGAPGVKFPGRNYTGAVYAIYGRDGGYESTINLENLNSTQGFRIDGTSDTNINGAIRVSCSSAGDVNGDSIDDLIIGGSINSPFGRQYAGSSYVIYGKAGGYENSIELASLNSAQGFRIDGAEAYDYSGVSVRSAGDFNNDGINDLVIGAFRANPYGRASAGASYVIYGKDGGYKAPIDLANLSCYQGFRIGGAAANDQAGISVSSAGDINNDGINDLIIGAFTASPYGRASAGSSYVIYGKTLPSPSPSASSSPSPSLSPSISPSPSVTSFPSISPSPSISPYPSPSLSPSASLSPTPSMSTSVSPTLSPSVSPSSSTTSSPSVSPSASKLTPSPSPSASPNSDKSSASMPDMFWTHAARLLKGMRSWWEGYALEKENLDKGNSYRQALLELKHKCQAMVEEAPSVSEDKWY